MRDFIKKLFIIFFLLNVTHNNAMMGLQEWRTKIRLLFSNQYVAMLTVIGVGGSISAFLTRLLLKREAIEKKKKGKRRQLQKNLKSLKKALKQREKLRQEFKQKWVEFFLNMFQDYEIAKELNDLIYDQSLGVKKNLSYIKERTEKFPMKEWSNKQQQYRGKMLKRRDNYLKVMAIENKINTVSFIKNQAKITTIINYCDHCYLKPLSKNKLEDSNIEESPSKTLFKEIKENKTYGEKAIEFIDEFLVLLGINPWNIKLGIAGDTSPGEHGLAKYEADFYGDKSTGIISAINVKDIFLNLNFAGFRDAEFFINSAAISHELGHLVEGHNFLDQLIPEHLSKSKSVIDLRRCFEIEADTSVLIKNKFVCFNALLSYVFRCIAFKNSNKLQDAFFNSGSSIHPSEVEELIHATDIYLQIHEPKKDYDSALNELKSLLVLELKSEIKNKTVNIHDSINYFFHQKNYPENFNLMVPRIIIDENYTFLPKFLPAK